MPYSGHQHWTVLSDYERASVRAISLSGQSSDDQIYVILQHGDTQWSFHLEASRLFEILARTDEATEAWSEVTEGAADGSPPF